MCVRSVLQGLTRLHAAQAMKDMLSAKTKMVALVHVSNMLGCVLPVHDVVEAAHQVTALRRGATCTCCFSVKSLASSVRWLSAAASLCTCAAPLAAALQLQFQALLESWRLQGCAGPLWV